MRGERPGNFQPLPLPAGEILAAFRQNDIIAARQRHNVLMDTGVLIGGDYGFLRHGAIPHGDIVPYGAAEKGNTLIHHRQGTSKNIPVDFLYRGSIKEDFPTSWRIQLGNYLG